jgi:hypothetical protein
MHGDGVAQRCQAFGKSGRVHANASSLRHVVDGDDRYAHSMGPLDLMGRDQVDLVAVLSRVEFTASIGLQLQTHINDVH